MWTSPRWFTCHVCPGQRRQSSVPGGTFGRCPRIQSIEECTLQCLVPVVSTCIWSPTYLLLSLCSCLICDVLNVRRESASEPLNSFMLLIWPPLQSVSWDSPNHSSALRKQYRFFDLDRIYIAYPVGSESEPFGPLYIVVLPQQLWGLLRMPVRERACWVCPVALDH